MAVKTNASETGKACLRRLTMDMIAVEIEGVTPYIPHRWSEKAKRMMPGHPEKPTAAEKKGARVPAEEAEACVYRLADGRPGIPATSIKAAMVDACRLFDGITMREAKLKFRIIGIGDSIGDQLIPFEGRPVLREDTPRNSNGGSDLRYRYAFEGWKATVQIEFFSNLIDQDSILALLDAAGRCGVGDWRPSAPKSATGTFGMFRVVTEGEGA